MVNSTLTRCFDYNHKNRLSNEWPTLTRQSRKSKDFNFYANTPSWYAYNLEHRRDGLCVLQKSSDHYSAFCTQLAVPIDPYGFFCFVITGIITMVLMVGFEPTRCYHQRILSPYRLPIPTHQHILVRLRGFEPPTNWLKVSYSTYWVTIAYQGIKP